MREIQVGGGGNGQTSARWSMTRWTRAGHLRGGRTLSWKGGCASRRGHDGCRRTQANEGGRRLLGEGRGRSQVVNDNMPL